MSDYSCYRSYLDVAWVQHHSYSAALQHKMICESLASQLVHNAMMHDRSRTKQGVPAQCNCAVLTNEMGGRFFLNFALTAPMLPCARVTCRSNQQEIIVLAYMSRKRLSSQLALTISVMHLYMVRTALARSCEYKLCHYSADHCTDDDLRPACCFLPC